MKSVSNGTFLLMGIFLLTSISFSSCTEQKENLVPEPIGSSAEFENPTHPGPDGEGRTPEFGGGSGAGSGERDDISEPLPPPQVGTFNVRVHNEITQGRRVTLTPPQYAQDPNTTQFEISYNVDAEAFDQVCFTYGENRSQCRLASEPNASIIFNTDQNTLVQWWAVKDGERVQEGSTQVIVKIQAPKIKEQNAAWDVVVTGDGTQEGGRRLSRNPDKAWARYDYQFENGKKWLLVSNVGALYNGQPDVQGNATGQVSSPACTIRAADQFPGAGGSFCPDEETLNKIRQALGMISDVGNAPNAGMTVNAYLIDQVSPQGSYWGQVFLGKPPLYLVVGYGYDDKPTVFPIIEASFNAPGADNLCQNAFKGSRFKTITLISGLKSLNIASHRDLDFQQEEIMACGSPNFTAECQPGDFKVNVDATYTGINPQVTFSGQDLTGRTLWVSCDYPYANKVEDFPLSLKIHKDPGENSLIATLSLKGEPPQKGICPYKKIKIQESSNQLYLAGEEPNYRCNLAEAETEFNCEGERRMVIGNWGVGCWNFKLGYQLSGEQAEEFETAKVVNAKNNNLYKKSDGVDLDLKVPFNGNGTDNFKIVPRTQFSLNEGVTLPNPVCREGPDDVSGIIAGGNPTYFNKMEATWTVDQGKYIEHIVCTCDKCDEANVIREGMQNNFSRNLTLNWTAEGNHMVQRKTLYMDCTIEGPDHQVVTFEKHGAGCGADPF